MIVNLFQFFLGAILLYYGAEFLITGSKIIAEKYNFSPIIVGITLVAFGTSLPELIVSIIAIIGSDPGIVIGNIIGSNNANLGLVLGLTALCTPIQFSFSDVRFDLFFLIFISFLVCYFFISGYIKFWHGFLFIVLLVIYCLRLYRQGKIINKEEVKDNSIHFRNVSNFFYKIILGIIGLGVGAHFFIIGAKGIAFILGVSSVVIGMSIVALGTSLPELAASISAAKHGQTDFIIGNIIGSNIINIIGVLGITSLIKPIIVNFNSIEVQCIIMLILSIIMLISLKYKNKISRFTGFGLLSIYILFIYLNFQSI